MDQLPGEIIPDSEKLQKVDVSLETAKIIFELIDGLIEHKGGQGFIAKAKLLDLQVRLSSIIFPR